ncbi:hypothetical protein [Plesiomonas shigelloides]|uniref:hypothetical protein n=1 Tax=Plesiomonas shigelloides TaxID=703 RepID=UPI00111BF8EA|nr:hypothetical protein [Plesiomonas shigelloides]
MPLNKAPSGALLFGGDMRLLFLLFSLFFSLPSLSAERYGTCSLWHDKPTGGSTSLATTVETESSCVARGNSELGALKIDIDANSYYTYRDCRADWSSESRSLINCQRLHITNGNLNGNPILQFGVWQYDPNIEPPPKEPCETPKTDDQCNKGKTATITGNDIFWATGNYKGCTFTAADGVFIKLADGSMTGDATSTGSTGKSWCETTDSSYNPADDEALSKNPAFSPAKDNDPKNCKNGWVQAGGGKFHCLNDTSGNVDAPPDKVNPEDGSINSDKDGKPKPPDAGVGKPPTGGTDPDGGGGTGPDGGGGDCEGEDCEGGGGGTKPPARPADPWADILDAADVARVKADTQSVQDELADFYRSAASGFQININKPAAGAMPSYGDITQGGQKISLSMSWLDKISFADGRAGVLVLCSLIAAYIILVRR